MKFLVDAQLPVRLSRRLATAGHDAVHTSELPEANRTTDGEIARLADAEDRVVVTKDRDFRDSHLLRGTPRRLLVVATGNITNDDLIALFDAGCGPARRRALRASAGPPHPSNRAHALPPAATPLEWPPDPVMHREDLARSGTDLARRGYRSVRR